MSAKVINLYSYFHPESYVIELNNDICHLTIVGVKVGRPSHRLALHQTGIKLLSVNVSRLGKNSKDFEIERINYLPTFQQVRLHTKEMMYPGAYRLTLSYRLKEENMTMLMNLGDNKAHRQLLPSVDENEGWEAASFEVKL